MLNKRRIVTHLSRPALHVCAVGVVTAAAVLVTGGAAQAVAPVPVGPVPTKIAVDTSTHEVFVVNNDSTVSRYNGDQATPTVVAIPGFTGGASDIAVDSSTHRVFVASTLGRNVYSFDGTSTSPTPTITSLAVDVGTSAIAVDSVTHAVYLASPAFDRILEFDGSAATPVVQRAGVGASPRGVAVDQKSHTVYVANHDDNTLTVFPGGDLTRNDLVSGIALPDSIAVDDSTHEVFVMSRTGLVLTAFAGETASRDPQTLTLDFPATAVTVDQSTHNVFVAQATALQVSQFDGRGVPDRTGFASLTTEAGNGLAIKPGAGASTLYVVDPADDAVNQLATTPVTLAPRITSGPPTAATVGTPYTFTFVAESFPPATFSSSPDVPGLTLDPVTGILSGTPTAAGSITIAVAAQNPQVRVPARATYTFQVDAASITPTPPPTSPTTSTGSGSSGGSGTGGTAVHSALASTGLGVESSSYAGLAALGGIVIGALLIVAWRRFQRARTAPAERDE